jgi:thiol-disulfide isomerase/thioredoxin
LVIRFLIVLVFIYSSCCPCSKKLSSQKVNNDGIEILYGQVSRDQLFYDFPDWLAIYENYNPDLARCDTLAQTKRDITVEIFFGSWCIDSKREVPKFFRIIDQAGCIKENNITLYAVDRQKKTVSSLETQKNIKRVATFIFYKNNQEIGRIIERPIKSLESDMLNIISKL